MKTVITLGDMQAKGMRMRRLGKCARGLKRETRWMSKTSPKR